MRQNLAGLCAGASGGALGLPGAVHPRGAARLFDQLQGAHGDRSFARRLTQLAKLNLLVIDALAISPMGAAERNALLDVLDDRLGSRSTLITSRARSKPGTPT